MTLVLSMVTGLAVTAFSPTAAQGAPRVCFGQPATITGDGFIEGTRGNDVIVATDPGSEVHAGDGNDRICGAFLAFGGDGRDQIRFGGGRPGGHLDGGRGPDRVFWTSASTDIPEVIGGPGDDRVQATGNGAKIVSGGTGDDVVIGGRGGDIVFGQGGDDVIHARLGPDNVSGGSGDDILRAGDGNDDIEGGLGWDIAEGGIGRDQCIGVERAISC